MKNQRDRNIALLVPRLNHNLLQISDRTKLFSVKNRSGQHTEILQHVFCGYQTITVFIATSLGFDFHCSLKYFIAFY